MNTEKSKNSMSDDLTKTGRVRKRKPKVKNMYFTQETEDAILSYISSDDDIERNKIFVSKINPAFYKLSENIIHTFKFYYLDGSTIDELKHECVSLLITKLKGYNQNKGKAFSYFGTILKRHLIVFNTKNFKKLQRDESIQDIDYHSSDLSDITDESHVDYIDLSKVVDEFIDEVNSNMDLYFPKPKDQKVVDAILLIFKTRNNIDLITKKSLYIYIREIVDIPTPNITNIIKELKSIYKSILNRHLES